MNFTDYRRDKLPISQIVVERLRERHVSFGDRAAIFMMLAPLSTKHEGGNFHRDHCFRVGVLADDIAACLELDQRACLMAGLLHDVGKALVPMCTLCATDKWTDADKKAMEPHVLDGFRMLRDRFDFTAHVIARHHRSQTGGYPVELPAIPYSAETAEKIEKCSRALVIADVFDAMHRVNSGSGGVALTEEQIREKMLKVDPWVELLYAKKVLAFEVQS